MTKKAATPLPCLRSHDISRFTPPSKDQVPGDEEILRLVQQMPSLCTYEDTEDEEVCGTGPSTTRKVDYKSSLRLVVPPDVDPASAASLEPSWFVNIVVTITDRNGCVIYHEAHFPKNPSLREGIKNFLDVRWGDFVHPPDADIWGHHLAEAFAEADRWRAARLAASQYPPPPTTTENGGGSGAGGQQRRRRVSSGGGVLQQQVVSTTSRLSPDVTDSATEEALQRRFVLSSLYRARWGGPNNFFYFRTVSLPFLRNQSDGGGGDGANDDRVMTAIANETTNVFSPTSSFENLLLLNYHCILGRVPEDSMAEAVSTSEKTVFDAVTLKVAQKSTDFAPLKSSLTPSSPSHPITTTSRIEQLSRVFCFDNLLMDGNESDKTTKFGLENQPTDFYRCRNSHRRHQQQGDHSSRAYRFTEASETPLSSLPVGSHAASYSSAHLAPVDIDWIDQSQPVEHQQQQWQQHYSGTPQVTSTVVRKSGVASNVECQKESSTTTESSQQRHQSQRFQTPSNLLETSPSPSPTLPPELGSTATQHDRISIFLSLLLPEAIKEIKEAVSAEPDMVARRVRAIVTRHLGPEILSKFFSNPVQTTTNAPPPPTSSHPLPPPPPSAPRPSTTSSTVTSSAPLSSLPNTRRSTASSKEIDCCGSIIDAPGRTGTTTAVLPTSQQSAVPLLLKKSPIGAVPSQPLKRPSLVQELSVASDNDPPPPPPPAFHNSTPGKKDFPTLSSGPFGYKPRGITNAHTPSGQNSGTTVSAYFDTMAGSSPWVAAGRVSQQVVPSLPPPAQSPSSLQLSQATTALRRTTATPSSSSSSSSSISSQEVHSTAGVLESLLMGGYVAPDSRTRHISGSSSTSITTPTTTTTSTPRHRNVSEVTSANASVAFECRHALSSSGPSSACCQTPKFGPTFNFDSEEWPVVASTSGGSSSNNNSPTTRSSALNSTSQLLVSPNSSSSCSSLAHLLRHGCPPAPLAPVTATVTVMSTTATTTVTTAGGTESMSSPTLSTACAVRANRMAAVTGTTAVLKTATTRPLDCPLSIIVDPQPPSVVKNLTHPSQSSENGHLQSVLSPKTPGQPPKLPMLATHPKEPVFFSNEEITRKSCGGPILPQGGSSGGGTIRKPNIRDTSEDEDAALANSSLCRLLQGPDPRWETVTTEVDATSQEDTPVAPPPPPPSFFELPPDVLVVSSVGGGGEVRRTRYDSCPMALRQPSSVPTPPQVDMVSVAPSHSMVAVASTAVLVEAPTSGHVMIAGNTGGGSCRGSSSSAPPSAVNAMDVNGSSPVSMERNRRAAAAAAAQIAEEAEHQRRQRPSSRHLLERQRLLFQQNVGQVTTYGSGSHSLLEGTSTPLPQLRQHQQSQPSCGYCNSGSDIPPTSTAVATTSCHPMQVLGTEGFSEIDGALPPSTPAASGPQPHFSVSQRTPLEDFSRRMKEIAPNVRVSPTGYHHHPSVSNLYPADQQRQKITPLHPTYDCSGGHLSLLDHEYHGHQQIASPPHGLFTANPPQYENNPLATPPSYTSHLLPIQPKATNNQHHILQPHVNSRQYQHQELQQQQQQFQYRPQPQSHPHHHQYQNLLYQPQRAPLPQSSSTQTLRVPEAYSNSSNMGYYESQFGFQQQQQHHIPQQLPPQHHNYVSPLSVALQQNHSLPHSQVKASLREKVTSRCQARGMDVIPTSAAPPPPSLPLSTIPPHSVGSAVAVVIGHKRPHPPDTLNHHCVVDSDDEFFYGPPPQPQYQENLENTGCEVDMPFLNDSTYNCYELSQQQAPFPQQPQFAECRSSMLYEPQQYASVCDTSSTDNASTMAATNSNNDNSKVNEDIQLTADIVNDVLELEALL